MIPGFVRVSVKGQQCQRFVNLCRGREMDLKKIKKSQHFGDYEAAVMSLFGEQEILKV